MSKRHLKDYDAEYHDIYLGKNRRLADPIFFPAPYFKNTKRMKERLINDMESEPDGPRVATKRAMSYWGWGRYIRYPPGGPIPSLEDYEKAMKAMAADVHETWSKIQRLVHNNEDDIWRWVLASPAAKEDGNKVTDFNECHKDIRIFMEPKFIESDFQIRVPEFESVRRAHFTFVAREYTTKLNYLISPNRYQWIPIFKHGFNFCDDRSVEDWPHETEPSDESQIQLGRQDWREFYQNKRALFNQKGWREFYQNNRALFLVPYLASLDLFNKFCLVSFIHSRGRQHPSVFAKMDNDMTFICRRTYNLTGPLIQNRMVSFDVSGPSSANGYRPKLWKESWIMLQSQRATYHFLWNILVSICNEVGRAPMASLTSKSLDKQDEILRVKRMQMNMIKNKLSKLDCAVFNQYKPFLNPPAQISSRYYIDLQSKMEIAQTHLQDLFSNPMYLFESLYALKKHHWGNISIKEMDDKSPIFDQYSIYMEHYADEQIRHKLYFDLLRGVLRRAIFEFYIWHSIHVRLKEFETLLKDKFPDYGEELDPHGDGTSSLQQPPLLLSDKAAREHAALAEKYLSLVVLIRYHAVFFVNEFRKRGIHAGASTLCHLAYSIGPPREKTQDQQCDIEKKHYGAPDLNYSTKSRASWLEKEDQDRARAGILDLIHDFISDPLTCPNIGICEITSCLHDALQAESILGVDKQLIMTDLLMDTIDGLELLSSLADHLEFLWPAMERVGGAAVDEVVRRKYFDLGGKDISINFLDFDAFDFDRKVQSKRVQRLFRFFDELQGFETESISMGHARGDLKRFGASLLSKFIVPLNNKSGDHKANPEAISRLESAMGVTGSDYPFTLREKPFNLDKEKAEKGQVVETIKQPLTYRDVAAREKQKSNDRRRKNGGFDGDLSDSAQLDKAADKKQRKKQARRRKKAKARAKSSSQPASMPDVGNDNLPKGGAYDSLWEESLHARLRQFQLPPIPEIRSLVEPQVTAPPLRASLQPVPAGPDGRPKGIIKKREWGTLEAIYGIRGSANAAVSYAQLKAAMEALGYGKTGRGGSHMSYIRHDGRWPHDILPRGENIQLAKTHGRERAAAAKGKSMDWGRRLCERGLTFSFIKEWYMRG
ncbi:hypothetical protein V8C35DRAFT_332772 [Trichoderma chlorosporum]